MNSENSAKIYIIEIKIVSSFLVPDSEKTRGGEMKVSSTMLLKTNGEKMSVLGLSTMLLKKHELYLDFHDVDEKKGSYLE